MEEEKNNYFSSTLDFEQLKAPPPFPLPHIGIYISNLLGRGLKNIKYEPGIIPQASKVSHVFSWKLRSRGIVSASYLSFLLYLETGKTKLKE